MTTPGRVFISVLLVAAFTGPIRSQSNEDQSASVTEESFSLAALPPPWEYLDHDDGVWIYRKKMEDSPIYAFRGMSVLDGPLEQVATIFVDLKFVKDWTENLAEVKILRQISYDDWLVYSRFRLPFFFRDRDFLYRTHLNIFIHPIFKGETFELSYQSVKDESVPPFPQYVRGDISGSFYRLSSLEKSTKTLVDLEIYCDPKGNIPKWFANLFQKNWPRASIQRLRTELVKGTKMVHPIVQERLDLLRKSQAQPSQKSMIPQDPGLVSPHGVPPQAR